jgi:hypothetical protein
MIAIEQITDSLLKAVDELNQELPPREKLPRNPHAPLFGRNGHLDSLGLVNLVILAERNIQRDLGYAIALADERAISEERSPFQSINSMANYVAKLINSRGNGLE